MPTDDDTPSSTGATNVSLAQRSANAPYPRESVNIQGDENPWKALGFNGDGALTTLSAAEMIEADPEAARTALEVSESPFVSVDTEAEFDAALADGRSIVLRGEGTGGVIALTTPKTITSRFTEIRSDSGAVLSFTIPITDPTGSPVAGFPAGAGLPTVPQNTPAQSPRAITILADDVTLRNFELTATQPVTSNSCYGIVLSEAAGAPGHRLKLIDLHVHNWGRCMNKDADYLDSGLDAPIHEDILIERCYFHTFNWAGLSLHYGFRRLAVRDTRILGRIASDPGDPLNTHHNCVSGGSNWYDCVLENSHFANCGRIVVELVLVHFTYFQERSRMSNCLVENCRGMGISIMFGLETVIEKCMVRNVHFNGIETGGRNPEAFPGQPFRYGQSLIESCVVDGVDSQTPVSGDTGSGQAIGISIDGARDTMVRGATFISNITSSAVVHGAAGIKIISSERCSVQGALLQNAGFRYILVSSGHSPNTRGFHEITGNTFRNTYATPVEPPVQAVYIHDTSAEVRQNVAWQAAGSTLNYCYNVVAPSVVTCDGVPLPPAPAEETVFPATGTNLILPAGIANPAPTSPPYWIPVP